MGLIPAYSLPSITVGGRVFTDVKNLLILSTGVDDSGVRGTFRLTNSGGYQVPVGKTLRIGAIKLINRTTVITQAGLFYSDNDCGVNSATAGTNKVYPFAAAYLGIPGLLPASTSIEGAVNFAVPAGKYAGLEWVAGASATCIAYAFGYLE